MSNLLRTVKPGCEPLEDRNLLSATALSAPVEIQAVPNDTYSAQQWALANISAYGAWDITTGTGSTIVATIDTGVDYTDADLAANIWSGKGYNFVANNANPLDDNNHGTVVAGIIGAVGNNSRGVVGVDWHAQIMALKFVDASGSGVTSNAVLALNFAVAHGAKIVNMSFAGSGYDASMYNALVNARNHGIIVVAAAGNEHANNDVTPSYPANYALDNVISVAAIDSANNLASFSNYGAHTVDLAAPGVGILSTVRGNGYASYSGTSMAAPFVAGAAELIWDLHPNWTYLQVIGTIERNVDVVPSLVGKTKTGGKLNLSKAIHDGLVVATPVAPVKTVTPTPVASTTPPTSTYVNANAVGLSSNGSITSTITVNASIPITRIAIKLNINASADQNLVITLRSPTGKTITLVNRSGGTGKSFTNTILDDFAATYVGRSAAPLSGTFKPDSALSAFKGISAKGTWTITVSSAVKGTSGTLLNWSLIVNPGSVSSIKSFDDASDASALPDVLVAEPTKVNSGITAETPKVAPTLNAAVEEPRFFREYRAKPQPRTEGKIVSSKPVEADPFDLYHWL